MLHPLQVSVPSLVRIKPGALGRLGIYLKRAGLRCAPLVCSDGIPDAFVKEVSEGMASVVGEPPAVLTAGVASVEESSRLAQSLPAGCDAVVGVGGGKALDVTKHVAVTCGVPCFIVPTSLSNDAFASPFASLTVRGQRRSIHCGVPAAVVIDTRACATQPAPLWLSGVGDLVAKLTAVRDWKLAFHARGTPVNDLAALMAEASVAQFEAMPDMSDEGIRCLATALMLNGVTMEMAGSSRPCSGSEHLMSHALDRCSSRPRMHGLQVGMATYLAAVLQGAQQDRVGRILDVTGFWDHIRSDPFDAGEWLRACELAPSMKHDFYTVLSSRNCLPEVEALLRSDPRLTGCFTHPC